jgi:hypothetical protein
VLDQLYQRPQTSPVGRSFYIRDQTAARRIVSFDCVA